jgi:hypothetical protein
MFSCAAVVGIFFRSVMSGYKGFVISNSIFSLEESYASKYRSEQSNELTDQNHPSQYEVEKPTGLEYIFKCMQSHLQ